MPSPRAEGELARMSEVLQHEAFYATGSWRDPGLGVYVGWTGHKESWAAQMPVRSECCGVTLVFSGEDFPEPGTARRLRERGHRFESEGPGYLVHLYEDDRSFPACLNGRFHGVLADTRRGIITLFNDRYGMRRVYYYETEEAFYFAAEAKALLAVRPELRSADPQGVAEFVACGCVLNNRTIFRGVRVLEPASWWVFRNGGREAKRRYFVPAEWERQTPLTAEAYYADLREAFAGRLPRYFEGHATIGVALTGGLDTRMIMAWQKARSEALPCYTFGGVSRDSQDVSVAREVARLCGQPHVVIPVGEEFLSRFGHYAERTVYLSDGCADVRRASDLYVSERAREVAQVKIVGTYGSELLRRVRTFGPAGPSPGLFGADLLARVKEAEAGYWELLREHPVTFAAFRQSPWWHHGIMAIEETQLTVRAPYLDNEFVRMMFRAPNGGSGSSDVRLRLIQEGNPDLVGIRSDRGVGGERGPLVRAAARGLLELTFRMEHAYDYALPQWLARTEYLWSPFQIGRAVLGRHRFIHFRIWYREALATYVREMLLGARALARPYLERRGVEAAIRDHLNRRGNYTAEIHKLLTLELIHRLFLDS